LRNGFTYVFLEGKAIVEAESLEAAIRQIAPQLEDAATRGSHPLIIEVGSQHDPAMFDCKKGIAY
jgi:hypothetical protein